MRPGRTRAGLVCALLAVAGSAHAQRGRGAGAGQAQTPQAAAPIDLTGYWVSIVNEDWRWRMVTPPKGDYASIANLMTAEARKIADAWDPSQDGSCLAYGAAGLMRIPTRLHVTWENENTLKIDTDAGQQTRRLVFGASAEAPATRSLQGFSVAEWELAGARRGGGPGGRFGPPGAGPALPGGAPPTGAQAAGAREGAPAGPAAGGQAGRGRATGAPPVGGPAGGPPGAAPGGRGGNLKVVTTQMSGGWLRKNGVPYSESATMTEYYDRFPVAPKDEWLVVTTIVADPKYLTQEFVTSTHFRHEPDGAKWDPTPCKPGP